MKLLQADHVSVTYRIPGRAPLKAVNGVSFELQPGDSLGIVGESGCGKSTLARAIMGLQPLSGGTLSYQGRNIADFNRQEAKEYRRKIQMIFQDAVGSLNPRMTVRQTLEETLRVHRMVKPDQIGHRIDELLDYVGLPGKVLGSYPREMSGGQCQRVSFARCLALTPQIILADEPVSALDVSVQARILNLIKELQRKLGVTIVLISHDLAVVRTICEKVSVMYAGEFVESGNTLQVLDHPRHDYTKHLLEAVPDVGRALRANGI
jgi:ATPase components of various ABC-type transport systems, contain duplicated ATPase